MHDKQNGTFCNFFNLWTQTWCARLSILEYECLIENPVEPWYCKNCKKSMLPIFDLNNTKLVKDTHREEAPSNETPALTKSTIWTFG